MGNYNDLDVILKNRGYTRKPKSKPKEKEKTIPLGQQAYNLPLATMNQNAPIKLTDTPEVRTSKMMQQVKASTPNGAMKDSLDVFNYENQQKAKELKRDEDKEITSYSRTHTIKEIDNQIKTLKQTKSDIRHKNKLQFSPEEAKIDNRIVFLTNAKQKKLKVNQDAKKNSYTGLMQNEDFEKSSTPDKEIRDPDYQRINGFSIKKDDGFTASDGGSYLDNFNEDEKKIYNYLYKTQGKAKANAYKNVLKYELESRYAADLKNASEEAAHEHPIITSAMTVAGAPGAGIASAAAVAEDLMNSAKGNPININSRNHLAGTTTDIVRSTVAGDIAQKAGSDMAFLYNVGMSIGDNVANLAVAKAFVPAGINFEKASNITGKIVTGLMSSDVAANAIVEGKEKGYSDGKAIALGITQGLIEAATEKYSLDEILSHPKTTLKSVVRGSIAEGSEEVASSLGKFIVDTLVNGSESDLQQTIKKYRDAGYSEEDVLKKTLFDGVKSASSDFLAGALSGGVMSAANSAMNHNRIAQSGHDLVSKGKENNIDVEKLVIEQGKTAPETSDAYKNAIKLEKKYNDGKRLSDYNIGLQNMYNLNATDSQIASVKNTNSEETFQKPTIEENHPTQAPISDNNTNDTVQEPSSPNNGYTPIQTNINPDIRTNEENNVHQTASQEVVTPTKSVSSSEAQTAQNTNSDNQSTDSVINVGDKFKDTRTGNIITVVKRNENNTVVQVDNGTKTYPRVISNNFADSFAAGPRAEYMEKVNVTTENTAPVQSNTLAPNSSQIDSYINSHSGEKINVSIGNGQSRKFTIISSENGVLSFKSADGKVMSSDLNDAVQNGNSFEINYGGGAKITYTISPAKNINLTRVGDFYEAYGNDAADIADKLNLALTTKVVNGETVQMTGFPAYALDDYTNRLGNGYNFNIADTNVSSTNAESKNADNSSENMYENLEKLGLTYDEKRAILEYKSSGSYKINELLRHGEALSEADNKLKNDINTALDKFPIYRGMLYRSIGFRGINAEVEFAEFIKSHKGKSEITYSDFISASKTNGNYIVDADFCVNYEILCEDAKDVSTIGLLEENEVLFKTDIKFSILDFTVNNNVVNIKIKELTNYDTEKDNRTGQNNRNGQTVEGRNRETRTDGLHEDVYSEDDILRKRGTADDRIPESQSDSNGSRSRDKAIDIGREYEKTSGDNERAAGESVRLKDKNTTNSTVSTNNAFINDNGKICFNQRNFDYENNKLRKADFNIYTRTKTGTEALTVKGEVVGKYGLHKNNTGKYYVDLLKSGMSAATFDAKKEARQFAIYVNDKVAYNNPIFDESFRLVKNNDFMQYAKDVKRILETKEYIPEMEIKDGTVPFKTKGELIEYIKAHKGDKVRVTFGDGRSEVRTIVSANAKTLNTSSPDGSSNVTDLRGMEISSTGFNIAYDTGVSVNFDFVNTGENGTDSIDNSRAGISHRVNTETGLNRDEIIKIISSINNGYNISLDTVKNAVEYLINSENDIKSELSALKNSDLQKLLNPVDRSRRTKKADMVNGIYSGMLDEMYYAVTGSDTISYVFDGTPIDTRMKNMLRDAAEKTDADSFAKLMEQNAAKHAEILKKRSAAEESLKNPQTLQDFLRKKNSVGLSEEETARFERMYAEERKQGREKKTTTEPKNTSESETFFSDSSNYTIEKSTHTKTGDDIWVVKPTERLETDTWKQLNNQIKSLGGVYWRGNQGWNFKKDPTSLFANISEESESRVKGKSNADKLRTVAESMQKAIDDKFKDRLTNTAKRAQEAARAESEGDRLKYVQSTINNIADAIESGKSTLLDKIDSRAQVETLIKMLDTSRRNRISETMQGITYDERLQEQSKPYSSNDIKYAEYPLTKVHENIINEYIRTADGKTGYKQIVQRLTKALKGSENSYVKINPQLFSDIDKIVNNLSPLYTEFWNDSVAERKRLTRMGIENVVELRAYLRELTDYLPGRDTDAEKQRNIKNRERELANSKIDGFFPTPKTLVSQMLDEADIKPGEKVLEPSAGKGNIADEIKAKYPDNSLDVVEWNSSLNELLSDKGHDVIGNDFLQTDGEYDKIIMNPPFENGQDIDHVKHAYDLLSDKGRIVAIMSEGAFSRSDKKAAEFREWLNNVGGTSQQLPEGTFKNSERSTGVNTRLVVIDKADSDSAPSKKRAAVHSSRDLDTTNTNQLKGLSDKLKESYETLKDKNDIFEINRDIISEMQGKNVTDKIYNYFNSIGGSVENPVLGTVELTKSGAKSTVFHGVGHDKIRAVEAIKPIIEKGTIISKAVDWKNRGYDTYIIAGKGNIDGSKSIVGVIVKTYPNNSKRKNKFYLHELIRIGADSDAVAKDSRANVNESTPIDNVIISQKKDIVNTYSTQNNEKNTDTSSQTAVHSSRDTTNTNNDTGVNRWVTDRLPTEKSRSDKIKESVIAKTNKATEKINDALERDIPKISTKETNLADIVSDIRDKFNIPIATGKVTDREASGIYKDTPETIRTRVANNMPTISHELGHHLDKKYSFSNMKSIEKLRKVISEDFLKQYPENERNNEAVAEFVRKYLKNMNEASRLCPDFYSDFVSTLSKEDLKAINEIATSINEYMSMDFDERVQSSIISGKDAEKTSASEKRRRFYTNWVDSFHPLKEATEFVKQANGIGTVAREKNAYVLATNSLNAATIARHITCNGMTDMNGRTNLGKSFVDCIKDVDSKDLNALDEYLVLKHSLEWLESKNGKNKRVFADDSLQNPDEIRKKIADIESKHPEMKKAAENLYEYQDNILRYFVIEAGGMSEKSFEHLKELYPCYVPFYRAVGKEKKIRGVRGTFANQTSPISRAKGSGEKIISPLESIVKNTEKMVKFAMRNRVMQTFADYADSVDGFGQYMEKIPPDMLPHSIDISAQKQKIEDALKQKLNADDFFSATEVIDEFLNDSVTDFTPIASAKKKIVTVLRDGKASYYQIHDQMFYEAIADMTPRQASGFLKFSSTIIQPMKLLITQNNPIFMATNAIRDLGTAYRLSDINNPAIFAVRYAEALKEVVGKSEDYIKYQAMGGGHSSELSANINKIATTLRLILNKDAGKARKLFSAIIHPVNTIASMNDVVETVPRFMEFKETMRKTGDIQQAIYNADDITTNFKRGGIKAKDLNKTVMFFNAGIQGLDKAYRSFADVPKNERNARLLKCALFALLMAALQEAFNRRIDEEGYENLSAYTKNNFYNFAIGDGKFIKLPKARELAILDSFTERCIDYAFGSKKAFSQFGDYLASNLLPNGIPSSGFDLVGDFHDVLGSTVFGGVADIGFNMDFKGTPIESDYDKELPRQDRYSESTTKTAVSLGKTPIAEKMNLSPKQIDHLISSYTGILGQINKALLPMSKDRIDKSLGLRNKFIADSNYSTDLLNEVYDNRDKAENKFVIDGRINSALEYEKNAVVAGYISKMNKLTKSLPAEQQRESRKLLLRTLNDWNYEYTAAEQNMIDMFGDDLVNNSVILNGVPSSEFSYTEKKKKYTYVFTPEEYTQYVKDYLAAIESGRKDAYKKCGKNKDKYEAKLEENISKAKQALKKAYKKKVGKKAKVSEAK